MNIWKESFLAAPCCFLIKHYYFIDTKLRKNSRNPTTAEMEKKKKNLVYSQLFHIISPYKNVVSEHFLWKAQQS